MILGYMGPSVDEGVDNMGGCGTKDKIGCLVVFLILCVMLVVLAAYNKKNNLKLNENSVVKPVTEKTTSRKATNIIIIPDKNNSDIKYEYLVYFDPDGNIINFETGSKMTINTEFTVTPLKDK